MKEEIAELLQGNDLRGAIMRVAEEIAAWQDVAAALAEPLMMPEGPAETNE